MSDYQKTKIDDMLTEILIPSSAEAIENRFAEPAYSANCDGRCKSGGGCLTQ